MTILSARGLIAAAVNSVDASFKVKDRQPKSSLSPRTGDGWVFVESVEPEGYRTSAVRFGVVVIVGSDVSNAESALDDHAISVLDALCSMPDLPVANVSVEPTSVPVADTGAAMYALIAKLTVEV